MNSPYFMEPLNVIFIKLAQQLLYAHAPKDKTLVKYKLWDKDNNTKLNPVFWVIYIYFSLIEMI